jgi:peptide-methionine (S)-S-oxide reductase
MLPFTLLGPATQREAAVPRVALAVALGAFAVAGALAARPAAAQHLDLMPRPDEVLPGRPTAMPLPSRHLVYNTPLDADPPGTERAAFGMGCFWGAELYFFRTPGVVSTAVGFSGGATPNPTYEEVCTGRTGHAEVVRVLFDPRRVSYEQLLRVFWENHDPTEGMRQGNDAGTQYRSVIFTFNDAQRRAALASRDAYAGALRAAGRGEITTEIREAPPFYFAEGYHQQYCARNPQGYCAHGGTGVPLPALPASSPAAASSAAPAHPAAPTTTAVTGSPAANGAPEPGSAVANPPASNRARPHPQRAN